MKDAMETAGRVWGIEIGGTKLQLGVADGSTGELLHSERYSIQRSAGAEGILAQIAQAAGPLRNRFGPRAIGIGFGGPVDGDGQRVITSHQVAGWDGFPLADWCQQTLGCPAVVGNDCNVAALAEARRGAGRGLRRVFYVTVGTGIGGGLVVDGQIDGQERPAVAEIGHLRPGLQAVSPEATVESRASGLGIEQEARRRLEAGAPGASNDHGAKDLLHRCQGDPSQLTTRQIAQAAGEGNPLATELFAQAAELLGWAIAQTITLVAPQRIVLGGGVSLIGQDWRQDVWRHAQRFVFPPLVGSCDLVPAQLGEMVVLYGAIELARDRTS
jgi:glucokinase